jgi:plastocyanin
MLVEIDILVGKFQPKTAKATIGDAVQFNNHDNVPHQVVADDGSFNTGAIEPGDFAYITPFILGCTVGTAGKFAYHCGLHPKMKGVVKVA